MLPRPFVLLKHTGLFLCKNAQAQSRTGRNGSKRMNRSGGSEGVLWNRLVRSKTAQPQFTIAPMKGAGTVTLESPDPVDDADTVADVRMRLSKAFDIAEEAWTFSGKPFTFVRPRDPEAILDDTVLSQAYDEMEWTPYWAQAWEASIGLCDFLAGQKLDGKRTMDLGCGLGMTSAVLLEAGATVVAGDNAPPALDFARLNTWPWRERCDVRAIDWRSSSIRPRFDLIVGSDILYDRADIEVLSRFFFDHLVTGGEVLLADPGRLMTGPLLAMLSDLGWSQSTRFWESKLTRYPTRLVTCRPRESD